MRHQAASLQQVLPTGAEVAGAVGNPLDPSGPDVTGSIAMLPNGIRDGGDVDPLDCLGAATPLMRVVYEPGDVREVALRDFSRYGEGLTVSSAHTGVVRFSSDAEAARMFAVFAARWSGCDNTTVKVHITATSDLDWRVTGVRQQGGRDRPVLSAVVLSGESGNQPAFPTEHALGLVDDCIAEADVAITDVLPARRVAGSRAVDLVRLMLDGISRGG